MKRVTDWADKKAENYYKWNHPREFARALRAAERRGYMRAVKLLREGAEELRGDAKQADAEISTSSHPEIKRRESTLHGEAVSWGTAADWLEQKR